VKPKFQEDKEDNQVNSHRINANNLQEVANNHKVDSSMSLELESTNTSPLFWEPSRILFQKLSDISSLERVKIH
jgi:hypothetical protein